MSLWWLAHGRTQPPPWAHRYVFESFCESGSSSFPSSSVAVSHLACCLSTSSPPPSPSAVLSISGKTSFDYKSIRASVWLCVEVFSDCRPGEDVSLQTGFPLLLMGLFLSLCLFMLVWPMHFCSYHPHLSVCCAIYRCLLHWWVDSAHRLLWPGLMSVVGQ